MTQHLFEKTSATNIIFPAEFFTYLIKYIIKQVEVNLFYFDPDFIKAFIRSHSKSSSAFQTLFSTETLDGFQISSQFSLEGQVIIKAQGWQWEKDGEDERKRNKNSERKHELQLDTKGKIEPLLTFDELHVYCF